ncbi:DUF982 domain-containing protein [Pararhizobium arenae]|uniref:DUF982 domain-containing protein n=1 Tax=Pararhizobium arenae TaxID=1856850 RepID=UPI00094AC32E|nr:DUF982 domain-containing protein [Pararhizobium arenae]
MNKIHWTKPVRISALQGGEQVINGPLEALESLNSWLHHEGWFFERAKDRCHAALEIGLSPEEARRAFIAAALDMNVPFA